MSQSGSWQGSRTIVGGRRTRQDAPRGVLTPPKMPMPMPMPMTTQQDIQDSRLGTEEPGARTQDTGLRTPDPATRSKHSGPRTPHAFATFSTFLHFAVNGFIFSLLSPLPNNQHAHPIDRSRERKRRPGKRIRTATADNRRPIRVELRRVRFGSVQFSSVLV
ncbi:uncharacterized protein LOC117147153 [Drosophila mauritiana]|uniref:Uncharacterized protein LOC117147153 n=1 Tax=Drosophila mauritiana TaxID=7226 RepID=A0A6P8KSE1_DROMA|nr:uncharacterized protein LOC117147153 [Drosophila mauritiana]